jgi:hypothetical protein
MLVTTARSREKRDMKMSRMVRNGDGAELPITPRRLEMFGAQTAICIREAFSIGSMVGVDIITFGRAYCPNTCNHVPACYPPRADLIFC